MAVIRKSELNKMSQNELEVKLIELRRELNTERGLAASGGRSQNPGKIKAIRRTVARILTRLPVLAVQSVKINKEEKPSPAKVQVPAKH